MHRHLLLCLGHPQALEKVAEIRGEESGCLCVCVVVLVAVVVAVAVAAVVVAVVVAAPAV